MSGVIALSVGILCFLTVLVFHFPQYLTTPELRQSYDMDVLRRVLFWAVRDGVQSWIRELPFWAELFLIILAADFIQYWVHRALHEVPFLWRFHAVHHSIKTLDWLAGSRLHIGEVLLMRTLVLAPTYVLGFSKEVLDAYIVIVGFQAVFNHANVSVRLGPLRYILVTPNFHHWHHSQDAEALDRNYAGQFAFLDYVFGTAVKSTREWPAHCGIVGDYVPKGFWKQFLFPFQRKPGSF